MFYAIFDSNYNCAKIIYNIYSAINNYFNYLALASIKIILLNFSFSNLNKLIIDLSKNYL